MIYKTIFSGLFGYFWVSGVAILKETQKAYLFKLGISDLYACIQFAKEFPEIPTASENSSWRDIIHNLLPKTSRKKPETPILPEGKYNIIYTVIKSNGIPKVQSIRSSKYLTRNIKSRSVSFGILSLLSDPHIYNRKTPLISFTGILRKNPLPFFIKKSSPFIHM